MAARPAEVADRNLWAVSNMEMVGYLAIPYSGKSNLGKNIPDAHRLREPPDTSQQRTISRLCESNNDALRKRSETDQREEAR
jgi:hypothetical protein